MLAVKMLQSRLQVDVQVTPVIVIVDASILAVVP
jgi:hypothetical protein